MLNKKKKTPAKTPVTPDKKRTKKEEEVARVTPSKAVSISLGRTFEVRTLLFVIILPTPTPFLLRQKVWHQARHPADPVRQSRRQTLTTISFSFGSCRGPIFCCGQWDTL